MHRCIECGYRCDCNAGTEDDCSLCSDCLHVEGDDERDDDTEDLVDDED